MQRQPAAMYERLLQIAAIIRHPCADPDRVGFPPVDRTISTIGVETVAFAWRRHGLVRQASAWGAAKARLFFGAERAASGN